MTIDYQFRLFVAGESPLSLRAIENFERLIARPLGRRVEWDIIDLIRTPLAAREDAVVATPTLLRLSPTPVMRMIGDLSDERRVVRTMLVEGDRPSPVVATAIESPRAIP